MYLEVCYLTHHCIVYTVHCPLHVHCTMYTLQCTECYSKPPLLTIIANRIKTNHLRYNYTIYDVHCMYYTCTVFVRRTCTPNNVRLTRVLTLYTVLQTYCTTYILYVVQIVRSALYVLHVTNIVRITSDVHILVSYSAHVQYTCPIAVAMYIGVTSIIRLV